MLCRPRLLAFTLIELLVVITIIAVLITLLLPSMDMAIVATNRAVCLANQRNTIQGAIAYGMESKQILPPSQLGADWADSWDYRDESKSPPMPIGLGLLVPRGFLPSTKLGKMIHCPSMDTPLLMLRAADTVWMSNIRMAPAEAGGLIPLSPDASSDRTTTAPYPTFAQVMGF